MSKIPETLRRLRIQKGIYLKEIASLLKVSVGTVSNYERGIHTPDPETLKRLAEYYGVSVDYLLGHTDCLCPISAINQDIYGGYTVGRFLELLKKLPEKERPYLVYMLKLFELQALAKKRH